MSGFNLFVYGSLRRRGAAHAMLEGCVDLGDATVNGLLYNIDGRYSALLLYGSSPVYGEVYHCPATLLPVLDEYEGIASGLYRRVGTKAERPDAEPVPCWVYTAGPNLASKLIPAQRIHNGIWRDP